MGDPAWVSCGAAVTGAALPRPSLPGLSGSGGGVLWGDGKRRSGATASQQRCTHFVLRALP